MKDVVELHVLDMFQSPWVFAMKLCCQFWCRDFGGSERVQKRIAHWNKQNNDVPAPNCMLKVQEKIIKVEGL